MPKKQSGIKKFLKTGAALAGAVALGYLGTHHEKKDDAKHTNSSDGLAALSPAKFRDMQDRMQGTRVTEYWAHIAAGKNPTPQESEARAKQIAQLSGVKDTSLLQVICEAGVPVEIQINGSAVRIDPTLFSDIELSRINGEDSSTQAALKEVRDSLKESAPLKQKSGSSDRPFISHADDF